MAMPLTVVVGLGKTGLSCLRFLSGKKDVKLAAIDSRLIPPGILQVKNEFKQVPIFLGGLDQDVLQKADELIISPGVALTEPAIAKQIKSGKSVIGDIELFLRHIHAPIVAITGSNGKSTVTSLVGEMAKACGIKVAVGGNLGTPVLDLAQQDDFASFVLELSSFQLETTFSLRAKAAVNLNVSPDHMDRYQSFEDYVRAKQVIYQNCEYSIINRDDPSSFEGAKLSEKIISFGLDAPLENQFGIRKLNHKIYLARGNDHLIAVDELIMQGEHQWQNILAALALGEVLGLPMTKMLDTVKSFKGLAHRCQKVRTLSGVDYYNDSKGTNVGASLAAINGLGRAIQGKIILIAGGIAKDADFSPLTQTAKKYLKSVVLIGQDQDRIAQALAGATNLLRAKSLEQAVLQARDLANPADIVLLSPACASFDMFKNFEQRGEMFEKIVQSLR